MVRGQGEVFVVLWENMVRGEGEVVVVLWGTW